MVMVTAKEEGTTRRVLTRAQSNIAPDDGGVAYSLDLVMIGGGIAATHAVRDGVIEGTARQSKLTPTALAIRGPRFAAFRKRWGSLR